MVESTQTSQRGGAQLGAVEAVVRPVLDAHGLELFDLSLRAERGGWVLRVVIDAVESDGSEQHVTVDQCADVSRDLSTALDVADPLPNAYTLEVSSPGVERPLRSESDYARFEGRVAKLALLAPMEGVGSVVRGTLAGVQAGVVKVDTGAEAPVLVPLADIKRANLVYEMPGQPKKGASKKKRRSKERRD